MAMASLMCAWDRQKAEQEFLRAIQLNPSYTQARDWYALFYLQFSEGRLVDGVEQAKLALKADPLSSYAHAVYGLTCGNAGNKVEAVRACQRAVDLDSESFVAQMLLQLVLHIDGKLEESVKAGESALAMSGRLAWSMAFLAVTYGKWGKTEEADALYSEMCARARRQYVPPAQLALAAAAASRESDALRHATEAFAVRDPDCQFFFSRHLPFTTPLYAYPRFCELLERHGRSGWLKLAA
jgi:tetratricopeptide (TPR) repeat protein